MIKVSTLFPGSAMTPEATAVFSAVIQAKRIIVITGAGISCSGGIPDFRSSEGLYTLVKQRYPDLVLTGQDLFDASLFRDPQKTAAFYIFIAGLKRMVENTAPSSTHEFIKALDSRKKLLRIYTQNIDGLENRVGLTSSATSEVRDLKGSRRTATMTKHVRCVQLHGDINLVRCTLCGFECFWTEECDRIFNKGAAPDCEECQRRLNLRISQKRRTITTGSLRPSIILYDEVHPLGEEIEQLSDYDASRRPDLLLVMGTSLKVHGIKKTVKSFARAVHASGGNPTLDRTPKPSPTHKVIFVNETAPASEWNAVFDYHVQSAVDEWVNTLVALWKMKKPQDWTEDNGCVRTTQQMTTEVTSAEPKDEEVSHPNREPEIPRNGESAIDASLLT